MRYLEVASIVFMSEKCIGCMRCTEVCPHQVFEKTIEVELAHKNRCIECGACQMNCPVDAISVSTGAGCVSAVLFSYLKKNRVLGKFIKSSCC